MSPGIDPYGIHQVSSDGLWVIVDGGLQDVCLACGRCRSKHPFDRPLFTQYRNGRSPVACNRGVLIDPFVSKENRT